MTRLGEGLEASGAISDGARSAPRTPSPAWSRRRVGWASLAIAAVGTAGLRAASNAEAVIDAVAARTGIRIEVIPGEEESRLAYLAVEQGLGIGGGSLVVFDTGGGSSQFTFGRGGRIEERFSLPVGAVRYTEQFGLDRAVSPDAAQGSAGRHRRRPRRARRPARPPMPWWAWAAPSPT